MIRPKRRIGAIPPRISVCKTGGTEVVITDFRFGMGHRLGKVYRVVSPLPHGGDRVLGSVAFADVPGEGGLSERALLAILADRVNAHARSVADDEVMTDIRSKMVMHLDRLGYLMDERDRAAPTEGGHR